MPGIVGIISQRSANECESLVRSMVSSMEHEAFYDSGMHLAPEMGIYAGWVAHKDSFAAGQPFLNEQKDIALLFSGECFVDLETRADLKRKGHELGKAAGSWLVHLYEEEATQFFEKLNGLFSGLLIDKRRNRAFLFNDRYGMERIYFCETKDATYFASEAKALLRILPELRAFDDEGIAQFLTFGCTLDWRTLFRGVHLLPGGSLWSFENGKFHKQKYFSFETWEAQPTLSVESFKSEFQETFKRILPRYFESESRIGISLTGGLDSRMLMACRPELSQKPVCYTFSGSKSETLDARLAGRVAKACGYDHYPIRIGSDFFPDFATHVDRTVYVTDGCFGAVGAHEVYLNRAARGLAAVRLTGVFGGEVLRGISTFKPLRLAPELPDSGLTREVNACAQQFASTREHPVTFTAFKEISWNIFGSVAACRSQVSFRTPYLDNDLVALAFQTPSSLRTSSNPAIRLVEQEDAALSRIPTDMGLLGKTGGLHRVWRNFFSKATFKLDYWCNDGLPHWLSPLDPMFDCLNSDIGLLGLHKYLRYRRWFRRELSGYITEALAAPSVRQSSFWNGTFVRELADRHIQGRGNYFQEINTVLTLDAVQRLLLRNP